MDILMPQLGETVAEGKITKWFKSAGDTVKPGDNLFEIETDKVSMEVPATEAGVLSEIRVAEGEVAPVGAIVGVIGAAGRAAAAPARAAAAAPQAPASPLIPAKAGIQPAEALGPRLRGDERQSQQSAPPTGYESISEPSPSPAARQPIKLDPFFEVRTPGRNFGPARLPGGVAVTPLARRLASEAGIDLSRL